MVFMIDEKPHPRFQREGDNLVVHKRISLSEALCGVDFQVQTLDNRTLTISTRDEVVTPHTVKTVRLGRETGTYGFELGSLRVLKQQRTWLTCVGRRSLSLSCPQQIEQQRPVFVRCWHFNVQDRAAL